MANPAPTPVSEKPPRRLVLLEGDEKGPVTEVLSEYNGSSVGASRIHADMVRAAEERPGRIVAVEWLSPIGWTRYLWCRR